jgi:hypothetical protein
MSTTIAKLKKDYADCFGSISGNKVLEDLKSAYQMRESYSKGDPYETARREGERAVYLRIINMSNIKEE